MLTLRTEGNINKFIIENTISPLMASGEGHLQKEREKMDISGTHLKRWL